MNKKSEKIKRKRTESRKSRIKELQKLKVELEEKLVEQKKKQLKQFNIRNLQVFKHTCNLIAPFILSQGIFIGTFKVFDFGFPFYVDEFKKYKKYNLNVKNNSYVDMNEEYVSILDTNSSKNELIIYSPWELEDDKYVRFKREYKIKKIDTTDLFDAVIRKDYDYVLENLNDFKEEKQILDGLKISEDNSYFVEAKLYVLDKEDVLKYKESDLNNIIVTVIELVSGLGMGTLATFKRKFNYIHELKYDNSIYKYSVVATKKTERELQEVNSKIMSLTKKGR